MYIYAYIHIPSAYTHIHHTIIAQAHITTTIAKYMHPSTVNRESLMFTTLFQFHLFKKTSLSLFLNSVMILYCFNSTLKLFQTLTPFIEMHILFIRLWAQKILKFILSTSNCTSLSQQKSFYMLSGSCLSLTLYIMVRFEINQIREFEQ